MKPRIYLAGPEVFFSDPDAEANDRKKQCADHGLEGCFPTDTQRDTIADKTKQGIAIYHRNVDLLDTCDAVIANMMPFRGPSIDIGTGFEIGYAIGKGKPIFGWSTVAGLKYSERVVTMGIDDGMTVEDLGLYDNPMVAVPLHGGIVHLTFAAAAAAASKVLNSH